MTTEYIDVTIRTKIIYDSPVARRYILAYVRQNPGGTMGGGGSNGMYSTEPCRQPPIVKFKNKKRLAKKSIRIIRKAIKGVKL